MSDDSNRDEAYLERVLNRGKDPKKVFGGGLEAARAKQSKPAQPAYSNTTTTSRPPPFSSGTVSAPRPVAPQPRQNLPPIQSEVVELSLPSGNISVVTDEEAARREEERMEKSIGRFVAPKSGAQNQGSYPTTAYSPSSPVSSSNTHVPTTYAGSSSGQVYTTTTSPPPRYQPASTSTYGSSGGSSGFGGGYPARGSDFVYPSFVVCSVTQSDNGATILPISSLACTLDEIYLGVRKNGNQLELRRSVTQQGKTRNESKSIQLPYQVAFHTASATYYSNKNNGELAIRLGKEIPQGSTSETEIARFLVPGVVGSLQTRVEIIVDQATDHFTFRPGPGTKYDTEFKVVLVGNKMEFKNTHSYEEGGAIKTVNRKENVQMAIPPTIDQVDVDGSTITVWPSRRSGDEPIVNDFDVNILLG